MRIKYEPKYAYGHFFGTLRGLPIIDQKKCQYSFSGSYIGVICQGIMRILFYEPTFRTTRRLRMANDSLKLGSVLDDDYTPKFNSSPPWKMIVVWHILG